MSYNTYLHYFLLYNATPPHAFLAQSPAFCFPAAPDDAGRCDLVQFVSSLTHGAEPDEVLIGYGVNDCEAAYASLPVALVLALATGCRDRRDRRTVDALVDAGDRHVNRSEAAWNAAAFPAWDRLALPDGPIQGRRPPPRPPPPFPPFGF